MRNRSTEHRHHRIPHELLHRPAIGFDLRPQPGMVRPDPRPHILRILLLRRSREADQIAEQHRDHLPLLQDRRGRLLDQRRRAERAKRKLAWEFLATNRAGRHPPSLGQAGRRHELTLQTRRSSMATARLDHELWKLIEPLLPVRKRRFHYPGRKRIDDRRTLAGILFVLRTGIAWQQLPQELGYGSGMTCWRRLKEWQQAGVFQALHEGSLSQLRVAGRLDLSRAVGALDRSDRVPGGVCLECLAVEDSHRSRARSARPREAVRGRRCVRSSRAG